MKVPFGMLPGHWGLKGRTRDHAKVDHYITDAFKNAVGHLMIDYSGEELAKRRVDLELKHNIITQEVYDEAMLNFIKDEDEQKKQALDLALKRGEITELEYSKEVATREGLPWFHIDVDYADGELELTTDWNAAYVDMLRGVGYKGVDDGDVIDECVRDFGRKLGSPDDEFTEIDNGMSFIKSERSGDFVSYK